VKLPGNFRKYFEVSSPQSDHSGFNGFKAHPTKTLTNLLKNKVKNVEGVIKFR
jgi:hypothetical protein